MSWILLRRRLFTVCILFSVQFPARGLLF
jgi:hypothetical protein